MYYVNIIYSRGEMNVQHVQYILKIDPVPQREKCVSWIDVIV